MKVFRLPLVVTLAASSSSWRMVAGHDSDGCTHGTLYMSDLDTATIYPFDLDGSSLEDLEAGEGFAVPGGAGQVLLATGSTRVVVSMYRGTEDLFFADGRVNFFHTAVEYHEDEDHVDKGTPVVLENAGFDCAHPLHYSNHNDQFAIFCDGSYDAVPEQINSTIWVVSETIMLQGTSTSESAIVYSKTLQGTHHGAAVPVDDGHVLYSMATPERINRGPNATATSYRLPATFQVTDYQGNVLHSLTDTTSMSHSCAGFHGSSAMDYTFALACNDEHGGILVVDYEPTTSAYSSRALSYPIDNHRTGTFADHHDSPYVVGNFAGENNEFHLLSFDPTRTEELDDSHVQTLGTRQCAFDFEKSEAELLVVFLQTGVVQLYKVDPAWELVEEVEVIEGMQACTEASLVVGYGQAFVVAAEARTLYALDLGHMDHSEGVDVSVVELDFTPNSAVVAGVPAGAACSGDHSHDHSAAAALPSFGLASMTTLIVGLVLLSTIGF